MRDHVETYLSELREIRDSGRAVDETSYYPVLVKLLNEVGRTLKPKVRCILTPRNAGSGIPDAVLFTTEQFQKSAAADPFPGRFPSRGVVEVKGTGASVETVARSAQVEGYCKTYGQVLVTNYREFLLVARDAGGRPELLERYRLAEGEAAFWASAARPRRTATLHCHCRYLNGSVYWKNVPARVWHYTIGGYQVIKKWLSYRERGLLGRPLRKAEVREVTDIARRIAAILLMEPDLDANYRAAREHPYAWPHGR